MIFKVLKDIWGVLPAALKGKQRRVWVQGAYCPENFLVQSGIPEAHQSKGAAFSCRALSHTIHGQALHGLQINNKSLVDILGLSH